MNDKTRILVIDDEEGIREMLTFGLSQEGFSVHTASGGEEGVRMAEQYRPPVCVLDIKMPGMTGPETLARLKKQDPDIEVIMATGYSDISSAVESLRHGAFDYISKPFDINHIVSVINRAIERRNLKETLVIYELSRAIFSTLEMEELVERIISVAVKAVAADDASLMLFDREGKLYIAASGKLDSRIREETKLAIGERIAGRAAERSEGFILVNGLGNDERFRDVEGRDEIKSAIVVPLEKGGKVVGVLNVNRLHREEIFTPSDLQKITVFASLAALAVENASLHASLRETQQQLIHSEKMAAVGRLAGGVAHEINNPVAGILGTAQLILEDMDETAPFFEDIKIIEESAMRCGIIVKRLLEFSRKDGPGSGKVNLKSVISYVISILNRQVDLKDIELSVSVEDGLPPVSSGRTKMEQVFLNLILNARDAMPEGGKISISAEISKKDSRVGILVKVSDTGPGIPRGVRNRIFDPFYTTKEVGSGTGLGLSIVRNIVETAGGSIEAAENSEGGAEFRIFFPVDEI